MLTVLWASQTGNCDALSRRISRESNEIGIPSERRLLNDVDVEKDLSELKFVVFVVSSTGDGEPPDNGSTFLRKLRRPHDSSFLKGMRFSILGLGDTNYETYQGFPRMLERYLLKYGATSFYPRGEADEAVGLEDVVEPWVGNLWDKAFEEHDRIKAAAAVEAAAPVVAVAVATAEPTPVVVREKIRIKAAKGPLALPKSVIELQNCEPAVEVAGPGIAGQGAIRRAKVLEKRVLTSADAVKRVLEMKLAVPNEENVHVAPGDAFGLVCPNDLIDVDAILHHLGESADSWVTVTSTDSNEDVPSHMPRCSTRRGLLAACDVHAVPRKSLLRVLAEYCSDPAQRQELLDLTEASKSRNTYAELLKSPSGSSLLKLLERFPSAKPPFAALLSELAPFAPRYYSISNAPETDGSNTLVSFAFSVVGLCTRWLDDSVAVGDSLPCFWRPTREFTFPSKVSAPMIMVAAGTGISPFMGFMQLRANMSSQPLGPALLFYGCRHPARDHLYKTEMEELISRNGSKTSLYMAYSRLEPDRLVYVQHRILEESEQLRSLMADPDATIYVCGDGQHMFHDVQAAFDHIFGAGTSASWLSNGRLRADVWSA